MSTYLVYCRTRLYMLQLRYRPLKRLSDTDPLRIRALPHLDPSLMPIPEGLHPAGVEFRQSSARSALALVRLARQPPHQLEVFLKVGRQQREARAVAAFFDPLCFPFPALLERWQLGAAGEDARREDGLPFEDFEGESCADLRTG